MRRKAGIGITIALIGTVACAMVSGCGAAGVTVNPDPEPQVTQAPAADSGQTETAPPADESSAAAAGDTTADTAEPEEKTDGTGDANADALCGEWIFVKGENYSITNGVKEDPYQYMAEDEPELSKELYIYRDGDGIYADYDEYGYESYTSMNHYPVEMKTGTLFDDCKNKEWYAEIKHPRREDSGYAVTLVDDNELAYFTHSEYESEEEKWVYESVFTFLRKDSEELKHAADYRYKKTVTVSTVDEFLQAIGNDTKIILNAGTYNLSEADPTKNTDKVSFVSWGHAYRDTDAEFEVEINEVNNLCIQAAEGAEVEICINHPNVPVLEFYNSNNIFLKGFTCGHHVEPGTCGGGVIQTQEVSGLHVSDCKLYGSGTYGLDMGYTYNITVDNTEIYDCTYGIISMNNSGSALFTNCNMHDCEELSMIDLSSCYSVEFRDCEFTGNRVNAAFTSAEFIQCDNECYYINLERCTFKYNVYNTFSTFDKLNTAGCVFKNNNQ